jgi:hypothetical protein
MFPTGETAFSKTFCKELGNLGQLEEIVRALSTPGHSLIFINSRAPVLSGIHKSVPIILEDIYFDENTAANRRRI